MKPVLVNGENWSIDLVDPLDSALVDRTGHLRLATTDPVTRTIWLSNKLTPPLLDSVLLHEVAHAITVSYGLLHPLRNVLPDDLWILADEWAVELLEKHSLEAATITSQALGRPICVNGFCSSIN